MPYEEGGVGVVMGRDATKAVRRRLVVVVVVVAVVEDARLRELTLEPMRCASGGGGIHRTSSSSSDDDMNRMTKVNEFFGFGFAFVLLVLPTKFVVQTIGNRN